MESFEKKIKERNNLLKSQVESLTGRNEVVEIIDTLLKAGVSEENLVEKAKYIRREADGKGGYKYIYSEPKEKQSKEFTTEDIKNMSSKEKIDLALRGNAAAQRALDYGEYQHFLHLSQKENKIKTDKIDNMSIEDLKTERQAIMQDTSIKYEERSKRIKQISDKIKEKDSKTDKVEDKRASKSKYKYSDKQRRAYKKIFGVSDKDMNEKEWYNEQLGEGKLKISDYENSELSKKFKKSSISDLEKAKADKKQQKKIKKVMDEWKAGTLKTSSGEPVKDQKQAIAIAMSEAGMSVKKSTLSTVLKQVENDIEKSHLGEFSYSEKLGIKKTGKEIKEKFKANLQKEQSEVNELKAKLGVLKTKIGEEPTKKCDYWQIDAYEDKGIDIPLVYDYSYMSEKVAYDQAETQLLIGETPKVENTSKFKYEYNEIVRKYIDCQKEILQINTILNNYKDTDIYQLTISQATVLGF